MSLTGFLIGALTRPAAPGDYSNVSFNEYDCCGPSPGLGVFIVLTILGLFCSVIALMFRRIKVSLFLLAIPLIGFLPMIVHVIQVYLVTPEETWTAVKGYNRTSLIFSLENGAIILLSFILFLILWHTKILVKLKKSIAR